jgi:hypothetical protein
MTFAATDLLLQIGTPLQRFADISFQVHVVDCLIGLVTAPLRLQEYIDRGQDALPPIRKEGEGDFERARLPRCASHFHGFCPLSNKRRRGGTLEALLRELVSYESELGICILRALCGQRTCYPSW